MFSATARSPAMPRMAEFSLAGIELVATLEGALVWPQESLVVLADLHLEKGSSFARRRMLLPPYDTAATLARLAAVMDRYRPLRVILLGDSFHDSDAGTRMSLRDRDLLCACLAGRDVVWITGNHDPAGPAGLPGIVADSLVAGPLTLRHEPTATARAEIAGHLHPAARVAARGRAIRRQCFVSTASRVILPAFGAYAGGLNIRHHAFQGLLDDPFNVHLLGDEGVFTFPGSHCLGGS